MSINSTNQAFDRWRYLIFLALASYIGFSTSVGHLIPDSNYLFHEGEYVGLLWKLSSYYKGDSEFPLLIHGAMDYIPSQVAQWVYGDDRIIVGTRIMNTVIVVLSWVIFLDLCWRIGKSHERQVITSSLAALILILISPRLNSTAFVVQQSFVGVRDLFLLLTIWFFAIQLSSERSLPTKLLTTLTAFSAVAAFFWSYDRGIMAIAFTGCAFAGLAYQRRFLDAFILSCGSVAALFLFERLGIFGTVGENFDNIHYWVKYSSEIFGYFRFDAFTSIIQFFLLLYVGATFVAIYRLRKEIDKKSLFQISGLILIQIILLKTVMNRAAMPRLAWAIWPSVLLMTYVISHRADVISHWMNDYRAKLAGLSKPQMHNISFPAKIYTLICFGILFSMGSYLSVKSYGNFAKNLFRPKPDIDVVSHEVKEIEMNFAAGNVGCIFRWANEGIFGVISKKQFCTRFPSAIYASSDHQDELLSQLKSENPSMVIFNVEGTFVDGTSMMDIDHRTMAERLPRVDRYIKENYLNMTRIGRYTVASK